MLIDVLKEFDRIFCIQKFVLLRLVMGHLLHVFNVENRLSFRLFVLLDVIYLLIAGKVVEHLEIVCIESRLRTFLSLVRL